MKVISWLQDTEAIANSWLLNNFCACTPFLFPLQKNKNFEICLPIKIEIAPLEESVTNSVTSFWESGSAVILTRSASDHILAHLLYMSHPPLIGGITAISSPGLSCTVWSGVMYSWFTARITLSSMEERLKESVQWIIKHSISL